MRHCLFHILALPLLFAAVLFALAQAWQAPLSVQEALGQSAFSAETKTALHECPTAAVPPDLGLWSSSDLHSEEPEVPQPTLPAARAHAERGKFFALATPPWPFRGPDRLLRPPTTLHCA